MSCESICRRLVWKWAPRWVCMSRPSLTHCALLKQYNTRHPGCSWPRFAPNCGYRLSTTFRHEYIYRNLYIYEDNWKQLQCRQPERSISALPPELSSRSCRSANKSQQNTSNKLKSFWYFCEPFMTQSATHRVCVCVMYMHAGPKACQRSRYKRTNQVPRWSRCVLWFQFTDLTA